MSEIVRVNGQRYLAGLFWYPLADSGKELQKQIRTLSAEQHAEWYVSRSDQVGLALNLDDKAQVKPGLVSIAATIANKLAKSGYRNYLVAYPTDDNRWLYLCSQNGLLLSDGDRVGDEDLVRERMLLEIDSGAEWQLIVAPANWHIPNALSFGRKDLFPESRWGMRNKVDFPGATPVKVNVARRLVMLAIGASVIGGGYFAWDYYQKHESEIQLAAMARSAQEEQDRLASIKPWLIQPSLSYWGPACVDAILGRAQDIAGWVVKEAVCDAKDKTVTVTWSRGPGAEAKEMMQIEPGVSINAETEPAIARKAYLIDDTGAPKVPDSEAPPRQSVDDHLVDSIYTLGNARPRLAAAPPSSATKYAAVDWTSVGNDIPVAVYQYMEMPGATLVSLTAIGGSPNQQWKVQGKQYVR